MTSVGQPERVTQKRVIRLFEEELGYRYLGNWIDRPGNSNVEEGLLTDWLTKRGYSELQISRALHILHSEADNASRSLYHNNQAIYGLLRYGVNVQTEAGENAQTVHLIDWDHPEANVFAIAEEVTLKGGHDRRPDLVLYVNGIAVGVIELKNSRVSIGDGIRQNLSNQQPEFHEWFFGTVQFLFAGNDSEGLKYGTIGTPEKYYLKWKEDEAGDKRLKLTLVHLGQATGKKPFLEVHNPTDAPIRPLITSPPPTPTFGGFRRPVEVPAGDSIRLTDLMRK